MNITETHVMYGILTFLWLDFIWSLYLSIRQVSCLNLFNSVINKYLQDELIFWHWYYN